MSDVIRLGNKAQSGLQIMQLRQQIINLETENTLLRGLLDELDKDHSYVFDAKQGGFVRYTNEELEARQREGQDGDQDKVRNPEGVDDSPGDAPRGRDVRSGRRKDKKAVSKAPGKKS